MGWWAIDPATGQPWDPTEPSIDSQLDEDGQEYLLGDPPWDYAEDAVDQIVEAYPEITQLSTKQLRLAFARSKARRHESSISSVIRDTFDDTLNEMWQDIDEAYHEAVSRPTKPEERRWIIEHMIEYMNEHC